MASSIEDILYAKALADASAPDPAPFVVGGAAMGGLLGTIAGEIPHQIGRSLNGLGTGAMTVAGHPKLNKDNQHIWRGGQIRPGFRAAGGLVGAIMGGALGAGVRDSMIRNSPEMQMVLASQQNTGLI